MNPIQTAARRAMIILFAVCFLGAFVGMGSGLGQAASPIHESVIAGTWYPAEPTALRRQLDDFLKAAPNAHQPGRLVALVAPHAGYAYSGRIAAHAYKLLEGETFATVVVIAPSHRQAFSGAAVFDGEGFRTPLGLVAIDRDLVRALMADDPAIRANSEAHRTEHALEIQLPFLQHILPPFQLVPLLLGSQDRPTCERLAATLARTLRWRSALLVASSDLSHYHPAATATALDRQVRDRVAAMDAEGLHADLRAGTCEACGGGAIATVILAARQLGATQAHVLAYGHSGEVTGDASAVVGYLAAALWATDSDRESGPAPPSPAPAPGLNSDEKNWLLTRAREALIAYGNGQPPPTAAPPSARLREPRGAFVTLKADGQLRGCIGTVVGREPLDATVTRMAVAAASEDPRFSPVTAREIAHLSIEISVLTPLERVRDLAEIEEGRHGLLIRRGYHSGLLLPQVASEYRWDRPTFLAQTCRKAGLDPDCWQNPATEIHRFEADVFAESGP